MLEAEPRVPVAWEKALEYGREAVERVGLIHERARRRVQREAQVLHFQHDHDFAETRAGRR